MLTITNFEFASVTKIFLFPLVTYQNFNRNFHIRQEHTKISPFFSPTHKPIRDQNRVLFFVIVTVGPKPSPEASNDDISMFSTPIFQNDQIILT